MTIRRLRTKAENPGASPVETAAEVQQMLTPGSVSEVTTEGKVRVLTDDQRMMCCEVLNGLQVAAGDRVLVASGPRWACVLGTLGATPVPHVRLSATETLTLVCGVASLTLRSNGQVLLKGEDVTVRAKGTQRIRAGNVAIN